MSFNFDRGDYMDFQDPEESKKAAEFDALYGKGSKQSYMAFNEYQHNKKKEMVQAGRTRNLNALIKRYKEEYPKEFKRKHPNGIRITKNTQVRVLLRKIGGELSALDRNAQKAREIHKEVQKEARRINAGFKETIHSGEYYEKRDLKRSRKEGGGTFNKPDELAPINDRRRKQATRQAREAYDATFDPVPKEDSGWYKTLSNIEDWLYNHKVGRIISNTGAYMVGATISGLLGVPETAKYVGSVFELVWQSRRKIAETWRKIKSMITSYKERKTSLEEFRIQVRKMQERMSAITKERTLQGAIPDRPSGEMGADLPGIVDASSITYPDQPLMIGWRDDDKNDAQEISNLRASVVDLIMNDSTAAKLLFEKPTGDTIAALMSKYNPNLVLPPGAMETIQNLVTKDDGINNLLLSINKGVLQLEEARHDAETSLMENSLLGLDAALAKVNPNELGSITNTEAIVPDNSGEVEMGGIANALYANFEAVKKSSEDFQYVREALKKAKEAEAELKQTLDEKQKEFERERDEEVKRKVTETEDAYKEREKVIQARLDTLSDEFTKILEQYEAAKAAAQNYEADKAIMQQKLKEEGDKNIKLTDDLTAISLKGEEQYKKIESMEKDLAVNKKNADLFQKLYDEEKKKTEELTKSKQAELDRVRNENALKESERKNKIKGLEDKIAELRGELDNSRRLIEAGNKRAQELADQVVRDSAYQNGRNLELEQSFRRENTQIRGTNEALRAGNIVLERQVANLKAEKDTLENESTRLNTTIQNLQSEVDAGNRAQAQFDAIQEANRTRIAGLETELERHRKENASLQDQILTLMNTDSEQKEALAAARKQNLKLASDAFQATLKSGKKYAKMETYYKGELDKAHQTLEKLIAKEKKYKKIIYDSQHSFRFIPRGHPVLREAEENLPQVQVEIQQVAGVIEENRGNLWAAMNGTKKEGTRATIGNPEGAALTGKAPDWNLQPNERIRKFWTDFYNASFHPDL